MDTLKKLSAWVKTHALTLIIALSLVTRLAGLGSIPLSLNWDEISMGYSAYSILETGRDEWGEKFPILFRSYGEWKSPVYIYVMVPFIKVFGLNAWGVRLPAALAGVVAIYLTYLIGNALYGKRVGLWASLLLTVSPWHLLLSRPAFEAGFALMLVLAGIYALLKEKPIGSALAFGFAMHTYHSAKFVAPIAFVFLIYTMYKRLSKKAILASCIVLGIFILPIAADFVTGKSQRRYAQVGITTDAELVERFFKYRNTFPLGDLGNKLVFNKITFIAAKGFSNWTSYLSPHFLLGSESIRAQHSIPFRGVLHITEFALLCVGLVTLWKLKDTRAKYLPLLLIAIGFIPPALTKDIYHVLRSIMTLPWWQIIAALGLVALQDAKNWKKISGYAIGILSLEVVVFLFIYVTWYPKAFARDWQYGHIEVAQWVKENEHKYKRIYMTKAYGEPQLFLAFYNKWDPAWYQEENKKLIEYESKGYPWLDQLPEYNIGKYTFRDINWREDNGKNEMVFIGKGDDFWLDTQPVFSINFPDGTNAFKVAEGH